MKTSFKTLSSLVLVTLSLVSSPSFAKSTGNGDGYQGPTLTGEAMAMNMDYNMKDDDFYKILSKVLKKCVLNQKASTGLLLESLEPMLNREKSSLLPPILTVDSKHLENGYEEIQWSVEGYGDNAPISTTLNNKGLFTFNKLKYGVSYEFEANNFPKILIYKKTVTEYDELTAYPVKSYDVVTNLKIVRPANSSAFEKLQAFHRDTLMVAPVAEFTDCLVDGLGRP